MAKIILNEIPQARALIREFAEKSAPRIAARVLRTNTIKRTKSGRDVKGSAFKKYSKQYAKYFRRAHELPTSPVDLYALGSDGQHMQESLDYYDNLVTTAGTGHALAVSRETNPRAVGNQRTRQWLGVARRDGQDIERELVTGFNRLRIGEALPHEPIMA